MAGIETKNLQVSIWRGRTEGRFVGYQVPARDNQTVLDVIRLPRRRLRFLRHDRQRPAALDLPHARAQSCR